MPDRGVGRMTSFFIGGAGPQQDGAEEAYSELRERSQIAAGCPARARRIFRLDCRFDGEDRQIEVGRPLTEGGGVVVAILDHGRFEDFRVHNEGDAGGPPERVSHPVYAVTEFS